MTTRATKNPTVMMKPRRARSTTGNKVDDGDYGGDDEDAILLALTMTLATTVMVMMHNSPTDICIRILTQS